MIVLIASVALLVGAAINFRRGMNSPQSLWGNVAVLVAFAGAAVLFFSLS